MPTVTVTITGLDALIARVDGLVAKDTLQEALTGGLNETLGVAMENCPVDSGRLRASLSVEVIWISEFELVGTISTNVEYAIPVHEGSGPHDIFPVNAKALHWVGDDGLDHYAKMVHHPGCPPNPFLSNALEETTSEIIGGLAAAIAGEA